MSAVLDAEVLELELVLEGEVAVADPLDPVPVPEEVEVSFVGLPTEN